MILREAEPGDAGSLADLWVDSWREVFPDIDFEARRGWFLDHLGGLSRRGAMVRVACGQTGALGFVSVDPATGHVDQLCVSIAAKGGGVAQALMAEARRLSPAGLHLDVNAENPRALAFYLREGFVETGRGTNPGSGRPVVFLRWEPASRG